jgi:hypothetical protein
MWGEFDDRTVQCMARGSRYLAKVWLGVLDGGRGRHEDRRRIKAKKATIMGLYNDPKFIPSVRLETNTTEFLSSEAVTRLVVLATRDMRLLSRLKPIATHLSRNQQSTRPLHGGGENTPCTRAARPPAGSDTPEYSSLHAPAGASERGSSDE